MFFILKKISHSVVGRLAIGAKVTGLDTGILMILMIWWNLTLKNRILQKYLAFFPLVTLFHILQQVYIIEAQNRNVVFTIQFKCYTVWMRIQLCLSLVESCNTFWHYLFVGINKFVVWWNNRKKNISFRL